MKMSRGHKRALQLQMANKCALHVRASRGMCLSGIAFDLQILIRSAPLPFLHKVEQNTVRRVAVRYIFCANRSYRRGLLGNRLFARAFWRAFPLRHCEFAWENARHIKLWRSISICNLATSLHNSVRRGLYLSLCVPFLSGTPFFRCIDAPRFLMQLYFL